MTRPAVPDRVGEPLQASLLELVTERRRRVAVMVPLVLGAFAPPFALLWWLGRDKPWQAAALLAAGGAALWVSHYARRAESLRVPANVTAGTLFAIATLLAAQSGGFRSTAFAWYPSLVLIAVFLGGRRDGGVWATICGATIVAFFIAERSGLRFAQRDSSLFAQLSQMLSFAGSAVVVYAFSRMFRTAEASALESVTEKHDQLERAKLAESEAARGFQLLLDSVAEGVIGVDRQGRITFVNAAADETLVLDGVIQEGKSFAAVCLPEGADAAPYAPEAARNGVQEAVFRQGPREVPVQYRVSPVVEEDGDVVGAVITFRDISVERELQSQLVQAQRLEAIGRLAAGVAHEINTPAQFVSDNVAFLGDSFRSLSEPLRVGIETLPDTGKRNSPRQRAVWMLDQVPEAIEQAQEGIERVATIVRALKEFSHPGNGERQPVDLNRVVQTTIVVARGEWKSVAEVHTVLADDLAPVLAETHELNQILLNLIVNAAHAIGESAQPGRVGNITVRTGVLEEAVWLEVEDDGSGIPEAIRAKVFDPFFTTKSVGKGTGQGLALVRGVMERHGGRVELWSELGKGSRFRLVFPKSGAAAPPAAA